MSFSYLEVLGILVVYQNLFFLVQLIASKKVKPLFVKVLIFICSLIAIHFSLMLYENLLYKQYFAGPFFGLLYGPIYYLFFKGLAHKEINRKREVWNFAPALLFLIIRIIVNDGLQDFMFYIGLLVTIHFLGYLLITLKSIFTYRRKLKLSVSFFDDKNLKWLEVIIYIQLIIIVATLPLIIIHQMDGEKITSNNLKGKVLILDFFGNWCAPCIKELKELDKVQKRFASNDNVAFYVINANFGGDTPEKFQSFIDKKTYSFNYAYDYESTIYHQLKLPKGGSLPALLIVDKNHVIRFLHIGYNPAETNLSENITKRIEEYLEEK